MDYHIEFVEKIIKFCSQNSKFLKIFLNGGLSKIYPETLGLWDSGTLDPRKAEKQ
jgi:hypothetical protein